MDICATIRGKIHQNIVMLTKDRRPGEWITLKLLLVEVAELMLRGAGEIIMCRYKELKATYTLKHKLTCILLLY